MMRNESLNQFMFFNDVEQNTYVHCHKYSKGGIPKFAVISNT